MVLFLFFVLFDIVLGVYGYARMKEFRFAEQDRIVDGALCYATITGLLLMVYVISRFVEVAHPGFELMLGLLFALVTRVIPYQTVGASRQLALA